MEQLDFITPNHYLYDKIDKVEGSLDRRTKAIFGLINELQDQLIQIKENYNQLSGNSGQLKEEQ